MSIEHSQPPVIARNIRRFGPLIIVVWLGLILAVTLLVPQLEKVAQEHGVSPMPRDAPAVQAILHMGQAFQESNSDSSAMIVLESEQPLGDEAHHYYDGLISKLRNDPKHIEHVQDLWGDRLTSSSVQSPDGKAAYVQLNLAGNQSTPLGEQSVTAVRNIVNQTPPPAGLKVYVTGAAPLVSDMQQSGTKSILKITVVTVVIIFTLLLLVYRSIITVIVLLIMVGIELAAARGIVALLAHSGVFVLSTFAVNMLVFLSIAAGTDYGIFYFGRYQEARQAGESTEKAYYSMYRGVTPVVLASGLTIAGAVFCLHFTRLPYFQTMGIPCAFGIAASVAVAITLVPAGIAVASRFGLLDPKRKLRVQRWRGIGTAVVRWPAPILAASCAVALIGLLALPGYQTSYNDRLYASGDIPANLGFAAAERHFSKSRMTPDVLMLESNHDMRNPTDFLVLNKLAKAIFKVRGISRVQSITRPDGSQIQHTSIPFLLSLQNAGQTQATHYQKSRIADMLKQANDMSTMIKLMKHTGEIMAEVTANMHDTVRRTHEVQQMTDDLRGNLELFDDFLRPIRNYFYWEPHCFDIPICWSLRSIFDVFDGADIIDDHFEVLLTSLDEMDKILPQLVEVFPKIIAVMEEMRTGSLTMYSTMSGLYSQVDDTTNDVSAMGQTFDAAKNDDTFFLPPEVFDNSDFRRAMKSFFSPDGKTVRFIISHNGDPASPEGVARIEQVRAVAEEALKGTPLVNSQIYIAGAASTAKDWKDGSTYDLMIAGIAAISLVFIIMLAITRSFVAALVIVGTVALSLGASFGMSVLLWQHIVGVKLHWMVLAMSVIILLAVGSDYNLLLVSRIKEEINAGINTGIIRAMGGTGKVVTSAGLVFACTMASMVVSDLQIIGQIGTTIGLGLLFDTLIVRSFMTPSIAALLGRWFWWPQRVRPRPAGSPRQTANARPLVSAKPGPEDGHDDDPPTTEFPKLEY